MEKKTGMSDMIGRQLFVAFDNASAHPLGISGHGASIGGESHRGHNLEQTHVTPLSHQTSLRRFKITCSKAQSADLYLARVKTAVMHPGQRSLSDRPSESYDKFTSQPLSHFTTLNQKKKNRQPSSKHNGDLHRARRGANAAQLSSHRIPPHNAVHMSRLEAYLFSRTPDTSANQAQGILF